MDLVGVLLEVVPQSMFRLQRFCRDERGLVVLKFAVMLPVALTLFGFALDEARYLRERETLQAATDAAALAAAKELSLSDRKYDDLPQIAQASVEGFVTSNNKKHQWAHPPQTRTVISQDPIEVEVKALAKFDSMFDALMRIRFPDLEARAVARVVGKPNICVLGLNASENATIALEQQARVTGQNCAVYSNSDHTRGIKAKNSANLTATLICSRGGKDGGPGNFTPPPIVDCPSFDDPLASRPEPAAAPCDATLPTVVTANMILDPGTYCGLEIRSGARVLLRDGIFVFKDKPLVVKDGGQLFSEAAGLFFTGAKATFRFEPQSTISLRAPVTGPMTGLLVFASRSQDDSLQYEILSDDARVMVGTIYIPKGELRIDATSPVADQSAYTAIVADKMRLYGGPHLVLNTNYAASEVPVPDGIRGVDQPVVLAK